MVRHGVVVAGNILESNKDGRNMREPAHVTPLYHKYITRVHSTTSACEALKFGNKCEACAAFATHSGVCGVGRGDASVSASHILVNNSEKDTQDTGWCDTRVV